MVNSDNYQLISLMTLWVTLRPRLVRGMSIPLGKW